MSTTVLSVRMELLSDTLFGSGFSLSGGADLSAKRDEEGFPYVSGTTFKGLLREGLENLLCWSGKDAALADELLGEGGYAGVESPRRVKVTALTLAHPPLDPAACYQERTFTALEGGVVKSSSLRSASCVARGQVFEGELFCQQEDVELLKQAIRSIRFVGTHRSRGLGSVRCSAALSAARKEAAADLPQTAVIRYRLENCLPVVVTDLSRSHANGYAARDYIPGTAVRGMVLNALAQQEPEWFEAHKGALLTEACFLDAVPCPADWEPLPPLMGFYGEKGKETVTSVLLEDVAGKKRVNLGTSCRPEGDTIRGWSGKTGGTMRIARQNEQRKDALPFQVQYLEKGQSFTGYILLNNRDLAPAIGRVLRGDVWLGADRHSGFGQCRVAECGALEQPGWLTYGYGPQDEIGQDLYLLAMTPLGLVDQWGEPCALSEDILSEKLGVAVTIAACSTALKEFSGFNRTWQCRLQHQRMYDRGSLFRLHCDTPPSREAVERLQRTGLGVRRAEGFGQVLFLRPELYQGIVRKADAGEKAEPAALRQTAQRRRERYQWLMEHHETVGRWALSGSQVGRLQGFCQQGEQALRAHLRHDLENRGAAHGAKYREAVSFIEQLLDNPPLGLSTRETLELISQLLDYSRKEWEV